MFRDAPLEGIAVQDVPQEHQRSEPVPIVPLWRSQGLPMCLVYCCGVGETEGLPQWLVRVSRVRDTPWRTLTGWEPKHLNTQGSGGVMLLLVLW